MLGKLNQTLRVVFIVMGAIFALFKLIEHVELPEKVEPEGFQTHEFDDIW